MPDHALELSFDADSEAAVVGLWAGLKAAGIPSQADHRSMTNAPHLTLVAAVGIDPALVPAAAVAVEPLLPATVHLRGLLVLGGGPRVTIAYLAEPDAAMVEVAMGLRAQVPTVRFPVWTPHVTLARRVPRRLLPEALEIVHATEMPQVLVANRLRWWDPDLGVIEEIAVSGHALPPLGVADSLSPVKLDLPLS